MNDLIVPLIWLGAGLSMLRPTRSRGSNIMGGVLIGAASMTLLNAYLPVMVRVAWQSWQVLGLGWFVAIFGGLALGMIWAFDRW